MFFVFNPYVFRAGYKARIQRSKPMSSLQFTFILFAIGVAA